MSAAQIIEELPRLTALELEAVRRKLAEMAAETSVVGLHDRGISQSQAADLRARLKTFTEDWDRPEAAIYDEMPTR